MAKKTKKIVIHSSIILGTLIVLGIVVLVFQKIEKAKADSFLSSDLNQDGIVDAKDIDLIKNNYANTAGGILNPSPYDLNSDHRINSLDLAVVEDNMGNGTDPNRDWDKDGYSVSRGDCQDRDKNIHPIAEEKDDQIDNNCNGSVDEFIGFQPLRSKDAYIINLHINPTSSQPVTVAAVNLRTFDTEVSASRSFGKYIAVMRDSHGGLQDAAFFDTCGESEMYSVDGFTSLTPQSCDAVITIPKVQGLNSLEVRANDDPNFTLPINLNTTTSLLGATSLQAAEPPVAFFPCPSALQDFAIDCYGLDDFPGGKTTITNAFQKVKQAIPYLTKQKLMSISTQSSFTCAGNCVAAYVSSSKSIQFNPDWFAKMDDDEYGAIIAHEHAHFLYDMFETYPTTTGGADYQVFWQNQVAQILRYLDTEVCKSNPRNCMADPERLITEWTERSRINNICKGLVSCQGPTYRWDEAHKINPSTKEVDLFGPRPGNDLGAVNSYGQKSSYERWATIFESMYVDHAGYKTYVGKNGDYFGFEGIIDADPPYEDGAGNRDTRGLTEDLKVLGNAGLIQDWDHDGVPDDFDNCAPQQYPYNCKTPEDPNQPNNCSNPNQEDFVDGAGNSNPNGIGDKCDFPGGGNWVSAGGKFSWGNPSVPPAWICAAEAHACGPIMMFIPNGLSPSDSAEAWANVICAVPNQAICDSTLPNANLRADHGCWYVPSTPPPPDPKNEQTKSCQEIILSQYGY